MNSFFRELKQRKVYRVAVGYAVIARLVVQVGASVMAVHQKPDWISPIPIRGDPRFTDLLRRMGIPQ